MLTHRTKRPSAREHISRVYPFGGKLVLFHNFYLFLYFIEFPQELRTALLSSLVKTLSLCCLWQGKTQTQKHPEEKQVRTRPNVTHCEHTFIIRP